MECRGIVLFYFVSIFMFNVADELKHRQFHGLRNNVVNYDIIIGSSLLPQDKEYRYAQVLICNSLKIKVKYGGKLTSTKCMQLLLCALLLLRAGDVETNPGPRQLKYPCQICHLACKRGQCAVNCDSCRLWYHKECMLMGDGVFDYLNGTDASWVCCSCGLPNFNSSFFSNHDFTHPNPFSPLSGISDSELEFDDIPVATSSPYNRKKHSTKLVSNCKINRNIKVVVVNCQSVKNKTK